MEQMNMPYNTFDPIVTTKNIGGHEFSSFPPSIDIGSIILQHEFDIMIYKGFTVVFHLPYADPTRFTELARVMSTLSFALITT